MEGGALRPCRDRPTRELVELAARVATDVRRIPVSSIVRAESGYFVGGLRLEVRSPQGVTKVHVELGEKADEALEHLAGVLSGFARRSRRVSVLEGFLWPAGVLAVALALAWYLPPAVAELQSCPISGRGLVRLSAGVMRMLGPGGALALCSTVAVAALLTIICRVASPPAVPQLCRA